MISKLPVLQSDRYYVVATKHGVGINEGGTNKMNILLVSQIFTAFFFLELVIEWLKTFLLEKGMMRSVKAWPNALDFSLYNARHAC